MTFDQRTCKYLTCYDVVIGVCAGVDDPTLKHRTGNEGYYGKGIYFSEFTHYSAGYVSGASKILLSKVLPGKVLEHDCFFFTILCRLVPTRNTKIFACILCDSTLSCRFFSQLV